MFGSEGCLKADVVPGCIFSTNYLFIIGHYSRTERRAVQRVPRLLETIMRLADWQTALSQGYRDPLLSGSSPRRRRPIRSMHTEKTHECMWSKIHIWVFFFPRKWRPLLSAI